MNEYYINSSDISGVQYYMIEMMQTLKEKYNVQNIKELINPNTQINRNIVHSRYTYNFDMIETIPNNVSKLFVSMNSLLYLLRNELYFNSLNNIDKIYLLNADGILKLFQLAIQRNISLLNRYKQISKKLFLLHEIEFENEFYYKSNLPIISIIRGLYFRNFKTSNNYKKDIVLQNDYFLFTVKHSTISTHTENDIIKAKQYCLKQNISFNTQHKIQPALDYKGLIYFRFHDYMPRLPYEFWYYNKDVHIVQYSDGLIKRMNKYDKNIYDWNLDNLF